MRKSFFETEGIVMAKKKPKRKTAKKKTSFQLKNELISLGLLTLLAIIYFQLGVVGRSLTTFLYILIGQLYWVLPLIVIGLIIQMMMNKKKKAPFKKQWLIALLLTSIGLILLIHSVYMAKFGMQSTSNAFSQTFKDLVSDRQAAARSGQYGAGIVGSLFYTVVHLLVERTGTILVGITLVLAGIVVGFNQQIIQPLFVQMTKAIELMKQRIIAWKDERARLKVDRSKPIEAEGKEIEEKSVVAPKVDKDYEALPVHTHFQATAKETQDAKVEPVEPFELEETMLEEEIPMTFEEENSHYILPSIELLDHLETPDQTEEIGRIKKNAQTLEMTFENFNVAAHVSEIHLGPAVTKYEVLPEKGVKVSRIVNLSDDIALALAAQGIRIEAPIPGKSAIGIEVPNETIAPVGLRELLEEDDEAAEKKLLVALGKDVTGKIQLTELNKMPHVLIAGSTGSGKSVCVNGIIVSLLMRAKPNEVKMMMIDPKMVELNVYNGIPHLLAPVVTDPRKAAQALQKVVAEMERRYELFSYTGTRNIEGYNQQLEKWNLEHDDNFEKMPYIVVIVDELADLMMVASNDVEDAIMRLAQMARAAGIHLIIATQRPSVDVITGIIKANIPSRIAFAVSSAIDSRTILDGSGAEKLLGRGDMLFLPAGQSKPVRVQGAFVSDREVEQIVNHCIAQQKAQYEESMIPSEIEEIAIDDEVDELYDDAVHIVLEQQQASISMLQRRLKIGYSRAARIVDQMEERQVVGPSEGSKPRKVLITYDE